MTGVQNSSYETCFRVEDNHCGLLGLPYQSNLPNIKCKEITEEIARGGEEHDMPQATDLV